MKQELLNRCGILLDSAIDSALGRYDSPLVAAVNDALKSESETINAMANNAVSCLMNSDEFKETMNSQIKIKLAKVLISQYGGEIEKSVNKLKSDPTTRARITLAIDSVISDLTN